MACGVGLNIVAVTGSFLAGLVVIALTFTNFGAPRKRHFLLQIIHHATDQNDVTQPLSKFCSSLKLVSLKNIGVEDLTESNYHITLRNTKKTEEMVRMLRQSPGVQQVNVFFDEDDFNPPTM